MLALALTLTLLPTADPKESLNPRQVTEKYLAAALADKPEEAGKLAEEGKSPSRAESVKALKELIGAAKVGLPTVLFSEKKGYALAVSDSFGLSKKLPDGSDRGCLLITLRKNKDGVWLIKDIDLGSSDKAAELTKQVKKLYDDAKELLPTKS